VIELEWRTGQIVGDFKKGMAIGTNDPRLERFTLLVHGRIDPPAIPSQAEAATESGPA
jgi:hypothetical protein